MGNNQSLFIPIFLRPVFKPGLKVIMNRIKRFFKVLWFDWKLNWFEYLDIKEEFMRKSLYIKSENEHLFKWAEDISGNLSELIAHLLTEYQKKVRDGESVKSNLPQNTFELLEYNGLHRIYAIDIRSTWYSSLSPYKDFAHLLHVLSEDCEKVGYYLKGMVAYNDHYIVIFQHR